MADTSKNLRIYNTLTRKQEPFVPIDPGHVRMYVCGPTVYDYAHIGNARPVIVFDVLFRLLRHLYGEDHVTYVRNITDVDDKINARARDAYPDLPLNEAIRKVTEATARQFHEDVAALGCLPPTVEPRATETIPEMIAIIEALIARGHAYEAEGHVLFDVKSWKAADGSPEYGRLSRRSLDDMIAGARVEVAPYKHDPMDFVLWKPSSAEEPGWESPWGRGRPGWHIECSAMSDKWLWEAVKGELSPEGLAHPHEFDIHGGGIDLTFPHHENEIAQSRCAHGTPVMAHTWMHNGFLQVEGQKMSKSLGNFVTINELLHTEKFGGRKWPGEVLRLAMLMTHYREPIDFSVRRLEEADNLITRAHEFMDGCAAGELPAEFIGFLDEDLNTPAALNWLFAKRKEASFSNKAFRAAYEFVGLRVYPKSMFVPLVDESLINRRLAFIREKNWAEADRIRDELAAQGIQLKDGKDPQTGERVTTWEVKR